MCSFRALLTKCQVTVSDSTLLQGDFKFFSRGTIIYIRHSKTIQFCERELQIPVAICQDKELCAVYWTQRHFSQIIGSHDYAFKLPALDGSSFPMPYHLYERTLKPEVGWTAKCFVSLISSGGMHFFGMRRLLSGGVAGKRRLVY